MNPAPFWAIIGLLLIGSEMLIPGFTIFFFGLGALLTALVTLFLPGLGLGLQAVLWLAVSLTGFSLLRRKFRSIFRGTLIGNEDHADEYAGREAEVVEEITPDTPGRIRFQGTSWEALSYDETIPKGAKALILRQEGMHFIVSSLIEEADIDM